MTFSCPPIRNLAAGLLLAGWAGIQPVAAATHAATSGPVVVDTRNPGFTALPGVVVDEASGRVQVTWGLGLGSEFTRPSVRLFFRSGSDWIEALAVTGDAGPGQTPGAGKILTWDPGAEGLVRRNPGTLAFEIKLVLEQEAGSIAEAAPPAPLAMPVLNAVEPVVVNFCYDSAAGFTVEPDPLVAGRTIGPLPGSLPVAGMPPGYQETLWQQQVMEEAEGLLRRAGVTVRSMTFQSGAPLASRPGARVMNVFFSPATSLTGNLRGFCDRSLSGSRFNRGDAARVVVFVAGAGAQIPGAIEVFRHPVPVGETVARQLGLALGLRPVADQATAAASVMDEVFPTEATLTARSDFSGQRLDLAGVPGGPANPGHNERYHLLRWVEGRTATSLTSTPSGAWDLAGPVLGGPAAGPVPVRLAMTMAETWYQVRVLEAQTRETSVLWREFAELTPADLANWAIDLPTGSPIRILASSSPSGRVDRLIAPLGSISAAGVDFSMPGAPALSVFRVNADGSLTALAAASLTATPVAVLPAKVTVDPGRFGQDKVWVQFDSIPGQLYDLERSAALGSWLPVGEAEIPAQEKQIQMVDGGAVPGATEVFYRVKVRQPHLGESKPQQLPGGLFIDSPAGERKGLA